MSKAMYALGRLKVGAMNRTEAAYLAQQQHAGQILWRKFEGLKLRPIQLRFAREALGLEGRMAWQGGAA